MKLLKPANSMLLAILSRRRSSVPVPAHLLMQAALLQARRRQLTPENALSSQAAGAHEPLRSRQRESYDVRAAARRYQHRADRARGLHEREELACPTAGGAAGKA